MKQDQDKRTTHTRSPIGHTNNSPIHQLLRSSFWAAISSFHSLPSKCIRTHTWWNLYWYNRFVCFARCRCDHFEKCLVRICYSGAACMLVCGPTTILQFENTEVAHSWKKNLIQIFVFKLYVFIYKRSKKKTEHGIYIPRPYYRKKRLKPLKIYIILYALEKIHMKNATNKSILLKYWPIRTWPFVRSNIMHERWHCK